MKHGKRVFLLMAECSVFSSEFRLKLHYTCLTIIIYTKDSKIAVLVFSPEENKVSDGYYGYCAVSIFV